MGQTFSDGRFTFDVKKLWELSEDTETETMLVSDLEHQLKYDCWSISPMEVCNLYTRIPEGHMQKCFDADMSYPILLTPLGHVCDGMHRLMKARMNSEKTLINNTPQRYIKIKKFEEWSEMIPAIIKEK